MNPIEMRRGRKPSSGSVKRMMTWTVLLTVLLAACQSHQTPQRAVDRPPVVAGEVRLNTAAKLMALPDATNAIACSPEFWRQVLREINRLDFLIEHPQ